MQQRRTRTRQSGGTAPPRRWRISIIRKRAEHLGGVTAADADEAIQVAIKAFGITDPERQRRLAARRINE